jgi:hypothetical protein
MEAPHDHHVVVEHRPVGLPAGGPIFQQEPQVGVQHLDADAT